jgi:peptidoglycan hydrolase-like protein with peptidoglycan-binding domain
LNQNGFALAATGPGSPGNETAYFGPLTEKAVIGFQEANAEAMLHPLNPI